MDQASYASQLIKYVEELIRMCLCCTICALDSAHSLVFLDWYNPTFTQFLREQWDDLTQYWEHLLIPTSIPEGVTFRHPDDMDLMDLINLYTHIIKHQDDEHPAFDFIGSFKETQGKHRSVGSGLCFSPQFAEGVDGPVNDGDPDRQKDSSEGE